jgi:uncharacterized alpha-E superfamily protein
MLSRVADSLYWTARYVERAEDASRLLHVNFHGVLDADHSEHGGSWRELLLVVGREELYLEHFDDFDAGSVSEFLLWHPQNPDSVAACVARARENARGVREEISSEMWEHLNRLHLFVARSRAAVVLARPHDFLARIREGSQAFQGVTKATLPRGEAYEFLQLGAHLERADSAARLLSVKQASLLEEAPEPVAAARMVHVLKCVGAMEAYRKHENDRLAALRVVRYLLLDRQAPRSVLFCLERCLAAIRSISGTSERPERAIGRIVAELSFADVGFDVAAVLQRVLRAVDETAAEIASAYFTTRVILPGPYAQQQQQQ